MLYNGGSDDFALMEFICSIERGEFGGGVYYDSINRQNRLTKIRLTNIVSFGVEIKFIYAQHPKRINITWKY